MKAAQTAEADTFEVTAREWFAKNQPTWAATHADKIITRLEKDAFPWLGKRPIREINATEILAVLRRIEARGPLDTAHRVHQICGQIFRYAVVTGRADRAPCCDLLHGWLRYLTMPLLVAMCRETPSLFLCLSTGGPTFTTTGA